MKLVLVWLMEDGKSMSEETVKFPESTRWDGIRDYIVRTERKKPVRLHKVHYPRGGKLRREQVFEAGA